MNNFTTIKTYERELSRLKTKLLNLEKTNTDLINCSAVWNKNCLNNLRFTLCLLQNECERNLLPCLTDLNLRWLYYNLDLHTLVKFEVILSLEPEDRKEKYIKLLKKLNNKFWEIDKIIESSFLKDNK